MAQDGAPGHEQARLAAASRPLPRRTPSEAPTPTDPQPHIPTPPTLQGHAWNVGYCAEGLIRHGVLPPFVVAAVDSAGPMRSLNYLPYKPGEGVGEGGWGAICRLPSIGCPVLGVQHPCRPVLCAFRCRQPALAR